ncbi:PaaI family thioesterase [Thermicanus aegyptius]|uniref:PaaI family thioesterase n=1 Tax=Thermicanus aegyptius TaxID=94009 RepID=UPI000406734E|nr:PaaI family thioesterase [Thermicanus aegyptius]
MIQQPLDEFYQFKREKMEEDRFRITMSATDLMRNSFGAIHGGVISTLIDSAMCNAAAGADELGKQLAVTVEMKINFLRPAFGNEYTADALVVSRGNRLIYTECKVVDENGELVATASGTYYRRKK